MFLPYADYPVQGNSYKELGVRLSMGVYAKEMRSLPAFCRQFLVHTAVA